jgi:serine protease Do
MTARFRAGARIASILLAFLAIAFTGCRSTTQSSGEDLPTMIHHAQEHVFPSLVYVKPIRQYVASGERRLQQVFGSGVIISPDGYVVTNSHVANEATEIKCVLFDSELLPARLVGLDQDTDLALIQIQLPAGHSPLPVCEFTDSDMIQPGQFVLALGSPFGFTRSISLGIISSPRRYLDVAPYNLWIQTDAAINPGNSGGPLVDARGRIVGITTLRVSRGENIGFAIPSNTVRRVIAQLQAKGKVERSYSGIELEPLKDFLRDVITPGDEGVLVGGVQADSPAASAGLQAGDLILSLNGLPLHGTFQEDIPEVRDSFASRPADTPAKLQVRRGEETIGVSFSPVLKQALASEGLELPMWNCSVQEISKFRTPNLAYFVARGVYVLGALGNARASGLRPGDVILSIDHAPIATPADIQESYRRLSRLDPGRRTALVEVLRSGYRQFVVLDFNRDYKHAAE